VIDLMDGDHSNELSRINRVAVGSNNVKASIQLQPTYQAYPQHATLSAVAPTNILLASPDHSSALWNGGLEAR
jgi:hypothetical protein